MAWFDNYVRAFVREGHSLVAMDGADVVGVAIYTKGKRVVYNKFT